MTKPTTDSAAVRALIEHVAQAVRDLEVSRDAWGALAAIPHLRASQQATIAVLQEAAAALASLLDEHEKLREARLAVDVLQEVKRLRDESDSARDAYKNLLGEYMMDYNRENDQPRERPEDDVPSASQKGSYYKLKTRKWLWRGRCAHASQR